MSRWYLQSEGEVSEQSLKGDQHAKGLNSRRQCSQVELSQLGSFFLHNLHLFAQPKEQLIRCNEWSLGV